MNPAIGLPMLHNPDPKVAAAWEAAQSGRTIPPPDLNRALQDAREVVMADPYGTGRLANMAQALLALHGRVAGWYEDAGDALEGRL